MSLARARVACIQNTPRGDQQGLMTVAVGLCTELIRSKSEMVSARSWDVLQHQSGRIVSNDPSYNFRLSRSSSTFGHVPTYNVLVLEQGHQNSASSDL